MQEVGIVIIVLGVIGFAWGFFQKLKAARIASAPLASTGSIMTGDASMGPKREVSAQGRVNCQRPVIAPFSGSPCLYYKIKCTAEWIEGETKQTKVIDEQKVGAPFSIDDGSGAVWVNASEGGDFDPLHRKQETKGGGGFLAAINSNVLEFGGYRVDTNLNSLPGDAKYTVEEEVFPIVERLYACGMVDDNGISIASPTWKQLILSSKSRDELFASSSRGARIWIPVGAAIWLMGVCLALVGVYVEDDAHLAPKTTSAIQIPIPATPSASPTTSSLPQPAKLVAIPSPAETIPATKTIIPPPPKKQKGPLPKKPSKQAKTTSPAAPKS